MPEWLWPTISERLWRLTLTEVGLLLILGELGAICIYAVRLLRELQMVNRRLRALRNDDDWLRARAERERLALNLDRHGESVAEIARGSNISSGEVRSVTGQPDSPIGDARAAGGQARPDGDENVGLVRESHGDTTRQRQSPSRLSE